jgi:peptidoglycan/LPS O-acetylase OafA/YrhL
MTFMTRIVITGLVAIHLAASLWHGSAHTQLAIALTPAKTVFVFAVILLAPLIAAALIWTRCKRVGLWVFSLSMLGAFLFGTVHHYVLVSNDNVHHLPEGSPESLSQFVTSAAVIALLELASALFGVYCLSSRQLRSRPGA